MAIDNFAQEEMERMFRERDMILSKQRALAMQHAYDHRNSLVGGGAGYLGGYPADMAGTQAPPHYSLKHRLAVRLNTHEHQMPFEFLECHKAGDKVYIFVVQSGVAGVMEDDEALFPSDTLISQLSLLRK